MAERLAGDITVRLYDQTLKSFPVGFECGPYAYVAGGLGAESG